jgi:hypothetical protein
VGEEWNINNGLMGMGENIFCSIIQSSWKGDEAAIREV